MLGLTFWNRRFMLDNTSIAIVNKRLTLTASLYEILQILSLTMF